VLRLLAAQPQSPLTLSELATRADINLSTCHGILNCLTEEGMVVRHEGKRAYSLGPLLTTLGAAATNQHAGLAGAREAIGRITDRFGLTSLVAARVGNRIVVLAHTTIDGRAPLTPQGFSGAMIPPSGAVFMAWAPPDEVDRWLGSLGPQASEADRDHHLRILDQVRRQGCLISLNGTLGEATMQYAARVATARSRRARLDLVAELGEMLRSQEYALIGYPRTDFIAAPVFAANGSVALTITVESPDGTMPAHLAEAIAASLAEECQVVSSQIGGTGAGGVSS
jgi:DNA-binding IclR family transcriptional regulator